MARIDGVTTQQAPFSVRIGYWFARRALRRLTGRDPEGIIEPLQVYAHVPRLMSGYARLEQATGALDRLPERYKALGELKAATMTNCEYCIDLGSAVARRWGLSDEELLALPAYRTSTCFDPVDRLVLDYAVGMTRTPVDVPDELFDALRGHFDDDQMIELTHVIALENLRGRFNLALAITAAGFSEGSICAVPEQTHPGD